MKSPKEKIKKKKIVISDKQFDKMRIVYAMLLSVEYYGLTGKDIFEDGVNPEWLKNHDVMGRNGKEYWEERYNQFPKDFDKISQGFFDLRKTKSGGAVVTARVTRLRAREEK